MAGSKCNKTAARAAEEKTKRLAEALRRNLGRRKLQARERRDQNKREAASNE